MFFKRISAYLIDCIILFFVITLVNFFIPISAETKDLNDKFFKVSQEYLEEKITVVEYNEQLEEVNYKLAKATYISSVVSIGIYILYFVVYQAYNNGQTLGKKLFKIQVVKTDDSMVDMNSLLVRGLIPYGLLVNLILNISILFINQSGYVLLSTLLNNAHLIIIVITLIMMMIKSRGIHDILSRTKVVQM